MVRSILVAVSLAFAFSGRPQGSIGNASLDPTIYYAQTKQLNQFIRRFNGEEDVSGKRYYPQDKEYRDARVRKKYLEILFDTFDSSIPQDLKELFILQVNSKKSPEYLDFHGDDWFSEISATFIYKKERVNLLLYMKLEKQNGGYKWVFSNVYFDRFAKVFTHAGDTSNNRLFIHPLSHEVDFMNIHKVFDDPVNIDYYLERNYTPDQLALFVDAIKSGNLKFETVNNVKFHFFQVPGWYFEVSYFNRRDPNSGWLISNLLHLSEKDKTDLIRNYTHDK